MELTYHGRTCIRLRGREAQVIVDPPETANLSKIGPDIVIRTAGATDAALLKPREGHPQEVAGAGEFEVRGVAVHALPAAAGTIASIEVDDVRVLTVASLDRQLTEDEIDQFGHVDVLVLPVGGAGALSAQDACKLAREVEPAIVVPVRYREGSSGTDGFESLQTFTREMGVQGEIAPQPKLSLTGSMPSSDEMRLVVLEPRPL